MSAYGGVISFNVKGGLVETAKFIDACRLPYIAPSLGGVESLIEQPAVISYWDQGEEVRRAHCHRPGGVRRTLLQSLTAAGMRMGAVA